METFTAKNVILASGGAGQCFKPTTNALICTGDGIAQAYRVGAPLMDMEMIQYHPTTLVENGFLITEGARGEGAHLLNADGERFMEKYAPNKMELASRDVVSRAEQTEINEGRGVGPDGAGHLPRHHRRAEEAHARGAARDREHRQGLRRRGHHARADPHPPGQHYIMGGVKTDVNGRRPAIPGLYAAGEVACVSVHGGNRLGANSLLDTLIFGRRSGEHAAARADEHARRRRSPTTSCAPTRPRSTRSSRRPREGRRISEIKDELGTTMNRNVAVFRDEAGLRTPTRPCAASRRRRKTAYIDDRGTVFNQDVLGAIELGLHARRAPRPPSSPRSSARSPAARSSAPTSPSATTSEWLKHIDISRNGDDDAAGVATRR